MLSSLIAILIVVLFIRHRNKKALKKWELKKRQKTHAIKSLGFAIGNINLIDKGKINDQIGTLKKMPQIGLCEYIAGIDQFDEIIRKPNFFKTEPLVNFTIYENGLGVSIVGNNLKTYYLALKNTEIKNIYLQHGEITLLDASSHAKRRAILGGLLFGPSGALLGGLSGMGKGIIKESDSLVITLNYENREQTLLLEIRKGKAIKVFKFFKENYPEIFLVKE